MEMNAYKRLNTKIIKFEKLLNNQAIDKSYNYDKWIYYPNFYCNYRHVLGTKGNNPIIVIGINPSTATPNSLDRTMENVSKISLNNGFDSFIMLNIYPKRSTNPNELDLIINDRLHKENIKAFKYSLSRVGKSPKIWAAWGSNIEIRKYLKDCLFDLYNISKEFNIKWLKLDVLSKHPHHPLYVSQKTRLINFNIEKYLKALK